jgi:hypothetical protein
MHLQTELRLAVVLATAMGCDEPYADDDDFDEPPAAEAPPEAVVPRGPVRSSTRTTMILRS